MNRTRELHFIAFLKCKFVFFCGQECVAATLLMSLRIRTKRTVAIIRRANNLAPISPHSAYVYVLYTYTWTNIVLHKSLCICISLEKIQIFRIIIPLNRMWWSYTLQSEHVLYTGTNKYIVQWTYPETQRCALILGSACFSWWKLGGLVTDYLCKWIYRPVFTAV
jgi:hypothetical protein